MAVLSLAENVQTAWRPSESAVPANRKTGRMIAVLPPPPKQGFGGFAFGRALKPLSLVSLRAQTRE
ncbi:hypothetical protein HMPREF9120_02173 [Neisseria sp. oral taxon 020 str. F0370]|nr:hypothetical protein HMPREF9120_02173 [Neisseria sp. oral taxon 020 str. F0370]